MNTHIRLLILCILSISATLGIVLGALFATGTLSSKSDDDNGEQVEDYPLAYQNFYEFDNGLETGNITTASSSNGTTDVIIIGLGLAGLAAAQTLGHSNLRVHVLEAMVRKTRGTLRACTSKCRLSADANLCNGIDRLFVRHVAVKARWASVYHYF